MKMKPLSAFLAPIPSFLVSSSGSRTIPSAYIVPDPHNCRTIIPHHTAIHLCQNSFFPFYPNIFYLLPLNYHTLLFCLADWASAWSHWTERSSCASSSKAKLMRTEVVCEV